MFYVSFTLHAHVKTHILLSQIIAAIFWVLATLCLLKLCQLALASYILLIKERLVGVKV